MMKDYRESDVLVIGCGIAGATIALLAAEAGLSVTVIAKGRNFTCSNSYLAQGGIATLPQGADAAEFIKDIVRAGDELSYLPAVEMLVSESQSLIQTILIDKLGVDFSRENGSYDMAMEGGHTSRRVLHYKDMTGRAIQERFAEILPGKKGIEVLFQHTAVDLLTYPHHSINPARLYCEPRVIGAYVLDQKSRKVMRFFARKVVLATGGLSSIYLHSTNPEDAVGSGIAMAFRAGARLGNMEYVQFHPTSLFHRDADSFLISEAVRGEGARLMNRRGEYFMDKYSPLRDLAPRDEVSRAIYEEMIRHGDDFVLLDLASFARINIAERFPNIYRTCLQYGINIEEKPIPVVPAAHYGCGGVLCDLQGRTSLKNLYAVGEVGTTGVHGANRLASVSLLEGLVWGARAARDLADSLSALEEPYVISEVPEWIYPFPQEKLDPALVWQDLATIRYTMWNYCGIIRTQKRMERACADLEYLSHRINKFYQRTEIGNRIINLRDSVQTALLVVKAALRNRASRGAHFLKKD